MESAHQFSSRPDCNNTAEVPSFTLRTTLSAFPFVSDLCGVDVQWFQERSSQDLPNSSEWSVHELQADSDRRSIQELSGIIESQRREINRTIYCKWWTTPTRWTTSSWTIIGTKWDLREAREKSLSEVEELKRFQGSTFDTIAKRKSVENQDTILELTVRIEKLQNETDCMNDTRDCKDAEKVRSGHSHVASQPASFPPHPVPGGTLSRPGGLLSRREGSKPFRKSKSYGADQQRLQISDLHFDKFPTPATFACWKIRIKTEVCTWSQFPRKQCNASRKWRWLIQWMSWDLRHQQEEFKCQIFSTRCEDCFSTEQNHP